VYETLQDLLGRMAVVVADIDALVADANGEAHAWAAVADAELIRLLGVVIRHEPLNENHFLPLRLALDCLIAALLPEQTAEPGSLK
jgi:hypothetical protein